MLHLLPKFSEFSAKLRKRCYIFCPNPAGWAATWGKDVTSFAQIGQKVGKSCYRFAEKMLHLFPNLGEMLHLFSNPGCNILRCNIFCPTFRAAPKTHCRHFEAKGEGRMLQKRCRQQFFAEKMLHLFGDEGKM